MDKFFPVYFFHEALLAVWQLVVSAVSCPEFGEGLIVLAVWVVGTTCFLGLLFGWQGRGK